MPSPAFAILQGILPTFWTTLTSFEQVLFNVVPVPQSRCCKAVLGTSKFDIFIHFIQAHQLYSRTNPYPERDRWGAHKRKPENGSINGNPLRPLGNARIQASKATRVVFPLLQASVDLSTSSFLPQLHSPNKSAYNPNFYRSFGQPQRHRFFPWN